LCCAGNDENRTAAPSASFPSGSGTGVKTILIREKNTSLPSRDQNLNDVYKGEISKRKEYVK
jgi:hypothetical protein